jgi:hypothetical protein
MHIVAAMASPIQLNNPNAKPRPAFGNPARALAAGY